MTWYLWNLVVMWFDIARQVVPALMPFHWCEACNGDPEYHGSLSEHSDRGYFGE